MPTTFRTALHGHLIEFRHNDIGGETLLLNGRVISSKPLAGLFPTSHFFEITDESGKTRHAELKSQSRWHGLSSRLRVSVDGVHRATLEPSPSIDKPGRCVGCGYELKGLTVENGEVKCPECGRHTLAAFVDAADQ